MSHPSALSAPAGGSSAKTCHHCSPPVEFEKVGQKKAHYRIAHQGATTITSPDNLVQIKCARQPDGLFHCPRGECAFTTADPTSLSGHSSGSCAHPWPPAGPALSAAGSTPPLGAAGASGPYFQVTSTAAALNQYAAAAAAASSSVPGHAPSLIPAPAGGSGMHTPTNDAAGTSLAAAASAPGQPVRPKRYFCRRCYPHLHFTSEIDKKKHIDEFHDGRARDRASGNGVPSPGGSLTPGGGEGKRKARAEGTPEGLAGGDLKPAKKRSKLEHQIVPPPPSDGDSDRESTPGGGGHHSQPQQPQQQQQQLLHHPQQTYQPSYYPTPTYASLPQSEHDQRAQYAGSLAYGTPADPAYHTAYASVPYGTHGLPPLSAMMPPPPHPSRHHSHSSGTMAPPPPPPPPSTTTTTTTAAQPAASGSRRKSRAQPEYIPPVTHFPCLFCVVDPVRDFADQEALDAHVAEAHDWRAVERAERAKRGAALEQAAADGRKEAMEAGWCELCVPRMRFDDARARDWHHKVAHLRLNGPPAAPPTPPPEPVVESTSATAAAVNESLHPVALDRAPLATAPLPSLIAPSPLHTSTIPPASPTTAPVSAPPPALGPASSASPQALSGLPSPSSVSVEARKPPRMFDLLNPTTAEPQPTVSLSPSLAPTPPPMVAVAQPGETPAPALPSPPSEVAHEEQSGPPGAVSVDEGAARVSVEVV